MIAQDTTTVPEAFSIPNTESSASLPETSIQPNNLDNTQPPTNSQAPKITSPQFNFRSPVVSTNRQPFNNITSFIR